MSFEDTIKEIKDNINLNFLKRNIWTNFCYYLANINNVVDYLKEKSSSTIVKAKVNNHKFIPLFFRPQNPFFYKIEGFRPHTKYGYKKYKCSFPVLFLFNLSKVLETYNTFFIKKGFLSKSIKDIKSNEHSFSNLPFDLIYNDQRLSGWSKKKKQYINMEQSSILLHRTKLPINLLDKLVVRSPAEADTLRQILTDCGLQSYIKDIKIDQNCCFFFDEWSYVNKVFMSSKGVDLFLNVGKYAKPLSWGSKITKPLDQDHSKFIGIGINISTLNGKNIYQSKGLLLRPHFHIDLPNITSYKIEVHFDNELAYYDKYHLIDNSNEILK